VGVLFGFEYLLVFGEYLVDGVLGLFDLVVGVGFGRRWQRGDLLVG